MKLEVQIIDNSTSAVLEVADFSSQADLDAWQAMREQTESFGDDQPKKMVITDLTAQDEQEKKVLTRAQVRLACLDIIDQIAAVNQDGAASDDQMDAFYTNPQTVEIILALLAGSPKAASRVIAKVGPSFYPQAVVDQFVAQLQALI